MKVAIYTLGCKVNQYETQAMEQTLRAKGHQVVEFSNEADAYVVNTCSVTAVSDQKSRQVIHRVQKQHPAAVVAVCGCYPQTHPEDVRKLGADLIAGTGDREGFVSLLEEAAAGKKNLEAIDKSFERRVFEVLPAGGMGGRTRAMLKIEDGCVNFCTYCIIPYARGPVRSLPMEQAVEQTAQLAAEGYREIVLTGIHISSYGIDFDEEAWKRGESVSVLKEDEERRDYSGSSKLIDLLERIHDIEGIERIRIGSLEPRIVTEETAARMAELPKLCPHFHLSLQSGCDATLRRMNRKYTSEEYAESVALLRKVFDHPAITTDVIVGFPGETEEEFAQTKEFLDRIQFFEMHIFKYSKRAGTRAAVMSHQVPDPVKTTRSAELLAMEKEQSKQFRTHYVGREAEVLPEETKEIGGTEYLLGHTRDYVKLAVSVKENKKNVANTVICGRVQGFLTDEILLLSPLEFSK